MSTIFKYHIKKFITLPEEAFPGILSYFEEQELKKKENLLVEGKVCRYHYFVLKGCLRMFFINDKGIELLNAGNYMLAAMKFDKVVALL